MNAVEAFLSARDNLTAHKLRSSLTMLGMIFGVGAVIAMLSIGAGAEKQSLEMIRKLGLRNVLVRAKDFKDDELEEIRKKSIGLAPRDAQAILEGVPGVARVVSKVEIDPYKILAPGAKTEARVFGVSAAHARLSGLETTEGRFFDRLDMDNHAQVCVIGAEIRRKLFGFDSALGKPLKINDVWCSVIGVIAPSRGADDFQGVSIGSVDGQILLPETTARRKFDREPLQAPLDEILVELDDSQDPAEGARVLAAVLERMHAGEEDYELVVPVALLEQSRRTQRMFNIVMGCIAGISLLVGGIGIMNIMLATVLERTREIGIRRAVGARRNDIRTQFIVESFSISLLGGLVGVIMGVVIARLVAAGAGWPTVVTSSSIFLSTGVALAVGLISGIYPAIRAANLDPIDALRYE